MILEIVLSILFILAGLALMGTYANKRLAFRAGKGKLIIGVLLVACGIVGIFFALAEQGGPFDVLAFILGMIGKFFSGQAEVFASLT